MLLWLFWNKLVTVFSSLYYIFWFFNLNKYWFFVGCILLNKIIKCKKFFKMLKLNTIIYQKSFYLRPSDLRSLNGILKISYHFSFKICQKNNSYVSHILKLYMDFCAGTRKYSVWNAKKKERKPKQWEWGLHQWHGMWKEIKSKKKIFKLLFPPLNRKKRHLMGNNFQWNILNSPEIHFIYSRAIYRGKSKSNAVHKTISIYNFKKYTYFGPFFFKFSK